MLCGQICPSDDVTVCLLQAHSSPIPPPPNPPYPLNSSTLHTPADTVSLGACMPSFFTKTRICIDWPLEFLHAGASL